MANELDELSAVSNPEGRDTKVIEKQIKITVGPGSTIFQVILWVLGIIPGLIFLFIKISAGKKLSQQQQKIQQAASDVDNYLEQRVIILKNTASILGKAIDLDKSTFTEIAKLRAGGVSGANGFGEANSALEGVNSKINVALEAYPELAAHQDIKDAMKENAYTQREITAARSHYNDCVNEWNAMVYDWPAYQIVAAKRGYTTRIPFVASAEVKAQAKEDFFK